VVSGGFKTGAEDPSPDLSPAGGRDMAKEFEIRTRWKTVVVGQFELVLNPSPAACVAGMGETANA
jgi:hypothetical protein